MLSDSGLLTTVCCRVGDEPPTYALEGSIAVTGSLVQWFRDNLELIGSASEIETLARTVQDSGGCYFVPAFSGLFAPHWRDDARGVIAGLTGYITKGHLARAVLEATAWQTREVVEAMIADAGVSPSALRVDGGMTANNLLMQFLADVLDMAVVRPNVAETVSLGAAYAAGLAVGFWPDTDALRANWHMAAQWLPDMEADRRERGYRKWRKAVQPHDRLARRGRRLTPALSSRLGKDRHGGEDAMPTDPNEHPAQAEQPHHGFAEGEEDPKKYPEDRTVGRFSEGEEDLPENAPEKLRHGRFSEGEEQLPEDTPEKEEEGRFSEGQADLPHDDTP